MADGHPWQTLDTLRREIDRGFNETGSRREPFPHGVSACPSSPALPLHQPEDKDTVYGSPWRLGSIPIFRI